ncbi:hypothetical protein E0Z10_g8751 [Xylaria hypoxylon]|uniref:Rhodopsin domain-containing protein n=1 Tax=Xylaria hypoxylon TaxID=37992 RepID=A0A4Z0YM24_9PEZI|nr:hypothetical protein E0Z10_g8751 [Xylaria hypoxylon]
MISRMVLTRELRQVIFIGASVYNVVIACGKAAVILGWIRIFVPAPTRNPIFYGCWAAFILNSLYYAAATVTQNVACTPYRYTWDKTLPGGHCIDLPYVYVASGSIDIVTDLAIFILPQQVIWQLQMSTKKKIGVSLIFAVGIFGILSAIFRVVVSLNFQKAADATYAVSTVALPGKIPDNPWTQQGTPRSIGNKYKRIYDSIVMPLTTVATEDESHNNLSHDVQNRQHPWLKEGQQA